MQPSPHQIRSMRPVNPANIQQQQVRMVHNPGQINAQSVQNAAINRRLIEQPSIRGQQNGSHHQNVIINPPQQQQQPQQQRTIRVAPPQRVRTPGTARPQQSFVIVGGTPSSSAANQVRGHPYAINQTGTIISNGPTSNVVVSNAPQNNVTYSNAQIVNAVNHTQPLQQPSAVAPNQQQPPPPSQPDNNAAADDNTNNVQKCAKFFKTLIVLSQQNRAGATVNQLVQAVISGAMVPEHFTEQLQSALNSTAQPHLLPFLKKTLPALRRAIEQGVVAIDGVNIARSPHPPDPAPMPVPTYRYVTEPSGSALQYEQAAVVNDNVVDQQQGRTFYTTQQQPQMVIQPAGTSRQPSYNRQQPRTPQQQQHHHSGPTTPQSIPPESPQRAPDLMSTINAVASVPSPSVSSPQQGPLPSATGPRLAAGVSTRTTPVARTTTPGAATSTTVASRSSKGKHQRPTPVIFREQADDDLNDVATMGGVNLAEESQHILASSGELLQTDTRHLTESMDSLFLCRTAAMQRLNDSWTQTTSMTTPTSVSADAVDMLSYGAKQQLRQILTKLLVHAEHRADPLRVNPFYTPVGALNETRSQLKFIDEVDRVEQQRRDEQERDMLMRLSKKSKSSMGAAVAEEHERLKTKAKELRLAEAEEARNREANLAAQKALGAGGRKRPWQHIGEDSNNPFEHSALAAQPLRSQPARARVKRVTMRDLQYVLRNERRWSRSKWLYRTEINSTTNSNKKPGDIDGLSDTAATASSSSHSGMGGLSSLPTGRSTPTANRGKKVQRNKT